jgi:hypothetical protein
MNKAKIGFNEMCSEATDARGLRYMCEARSAKAPTHALAAARCRSSGGRICMSWAGTARCQRGAEAFRPPHINQQARHQACRRLGGSAAAKHLRSSYALVFNPVQPPHSLLRHASWFRRVEAGQSRLESEGCPSEGCPWRDVQRRHRHSFIIRIAACWSASRTLMCRCLCRAPEPVPPFTRPGAHGTFTGSSVRTGRRVGGRWGSGMQRTLLAQMQDSMRGCRK